VPLTFEVRAAMTAVGIDAEDAGVTHLRLYRIFFCFKFSLLKIKNVSG
jgi:hypothetical protein